MSAEISWPEDAPEEVGTLGEPVAYFKAGTAVFVLYLTVGILALLMAAGALVLGIVLAFDAPGQGQQLHGIGKIGMLVLLLAGAGAATITKALTMPGLRVFVCAGGLARQQRDKVEVLRWDGINKVVRRNNPKSQEFSIHSPVQLVLNARDGREWVFDERVPRLQDLRRLVEERTLPFMLPAALEGFEAGAAIGFGEVSIDDQGLYQGTKTLSWDDFEDAKADKGQLIVQRKGQRKPLWRTDLAKVPNSHVLLALAEHAHKNT